MFMMSFQQNITFGGCNPFMMGCFNPRLNFFLGMAAATAVPPMPIFPAYNCSVFNPYMSMNYTNPFAMGGFGAYNYQAPVFNYTPQFTLPQINVPQFNYTNPFGALTTSLPNNPQNNSDIAPGNDDNSSIEGRKLAKRQGYGKEFLDKVKEVAKRLNCNYRDLLAVMNSESGIRADVQNKNGGASGLIQFMPKTAQGLGTTTNELRNMTPVQQLDYVERCIKQSKRMAGFADNARLSGGELYALIFLPARAKREVLTAQGEVYYSANKGLDANKDGKITKSELDSRVKRFYVSDSSFVA